jgi:hypothetical protein
MGVFTLYLLAVGNLGSSRFPRPVDPKQSWRTGSAARFQSLLLLIYPLISAPVALAYLARWALESSIAFYGALAFAVVLGAAFYWVAFDSSIAALRNRREELVMALSEGGGPIAG